MANLLCSVAKIEVDNRLPISYYFRMASHMIKQAKVYRDEHNVVHLYVILLKYSSLVTETISQHQNYRHCSNTEKMRHKKVLKEFEKELAVLRPLVKQKLDGTNRHNTIEISKDKSGSGNSCLSHRRKDHSGFTCHSFKSVRLVQDFLELARGNTGNNLETCGVLGAFLANRTYYVTCLIIPKQKSTSDSCQTENEEEIYSIQDQQSLFPLGWIHTHPSHSCFMSSIDLHTHYSYQMQLGCVSEQHQHRVDTGAAPF